MKKNPVLYKTLAFGVIVLFFSLGVQPAFATVQQENIDGDYVDVNIEICGLGKEHTVQLTRQQMDKIDILFESIKLQLDNVETEEETVRIFNEAIVELGSYGLLGDCSVKQVQELVTGIFEYPIFYRLIERFINRIPVDNDFNLFCLISGSTTDTFVLPPITLLFQKFISIMIKFYYIFFVLIPFGQLLLFFNFLRFAIGWRIPVTLGSGISLGFYDPLLYSDYPAIGWIHTYGMFGNINWSGGFYGQISKFYLLYGSFYIGVNGFIGLKIVDTNSLYAYCYYLGFANLVHIGSEPPYWER